MKERYLDPQMDLIQFEVEDVIATSSDIPYEWKPNPEGDAFL